MTIRNWHEFLLSSGFSFPSSKTIGDRVTVNLVYYEQNYLSIYLFCTFLLSLVIPSFVSSSLALVLTGILLEYGCLPYLESHSAKTSSYPRVAIPIGRKQFSLVINPIFARRLFGLCAMMIVLFTGGFTLIRSMAFATLIVLLHSIFRKRSATSRSPSFMAENFRHSLLSSFINSIPQIGDEDEEEIVSKEDLSKRRSTPPDPHNKQSKVMGHDEDSGESTSTTSSAASTPQWTSPSTPKASAHAS